MSNEQPSTITVFVRDRYRDARFEAEVPLSVKVRDLAEEFGESMGWRRHADWKRGELVVAPIDAKTDAMLKPLPLDCELRQCDVMSGDTLCIFLNPMQTKPTGTESAESDPLPPPSPPTPPYANSTEGIIHWVGYELARVEGRMRTEQDVFKQRVWSRLDEIYERMDETGRALGNVRDLLTDAASGAADGERFDCLHDHINDVQDGIDGRLLAIEDRVARVETGLGDVRRALSVVGRQMKITEFTQVGGRTICWLHLSDLHFCHSRTKQDPKQIIAALCRDLETLRDQGLVPQLVFFTGDAGFGNVGIEGDEPIAHQFEQAQELFEKVYGLFRPDLLRENFFLVPGNHDINRDQVSHFFAENLNRVAREGSAKEREAIGSWGRSSTKEWHDCMSGLNDFRNYLRARHPHLLHDPDTLVFADERVINDVRIGVAGLNSAWSCRLDAADMRGHVWLGGLWQFPKALERLHDVDLSVMLTHHPLPWFVDFERAQIEQQAKSQFHFWLHGHADKPLVFKPTDAHMRIGATSVYSRGERPSTYNITRLNVDEGTGEVWVRELVDGEWQACTTLDEANSNGVVPIYDMKVKAEAD